MEIHYPLQTHPRLFAIQNVPEKFPIDILDRSIFFRTDRPKRRRRYTRLDLCGQFGNRLGNPGDLDRCLQTI